MAKLELGVQKLARMGLLFALAIGALTAVACTNDPKPSESCDAGCGGGGGGCSSQCKPACTGGKLCCAYSGGACLPTDAGTCANNSGYSCVMPTASGVCPIQCDP